MSLGQPSTIAFCVSIREVERQAFFVFVCFFLCRVFQKENCLEKSRIIVLLLLKDGSSRRARERDWTEQKVIYILLLMHFRKVGTASVFLLLLLPASLPCYRLCTVLEREREREKKEAQDLIFASSSRVRRISPIHACMPIAVNLIMAKLEDVHVPSGDRFFVIANKHKID